MAFVQAQQVNPEEEKDLEHLAPGVNYDHDMKYLNSFSKQKPPSYDGKKKWIVAKKWLIHVEMILTSLDIPDNGQKTRLVAYTFTCDAEN